MSTGKSLPADVPWDKAASPRQPILDQAYDVWEALYLVAVSEHAVPEGVVIAEGVASLTRVHSRLQPQDGAASDELERIDLGTVADGRKVMLSCSLTGEPITVKHLAAGVTGDGEILLANGADLILNSPHEWLVLQRVDDQFHQVQPVAAGRFAALYQNLDMGGFGAFGGPIVLDEHASSARDLAPGDIGKQLVNTVGCTYTLPMAQPALPARQWVKGAQIFFRQEAASCIFRTSLGSVPFNLDNHDRGRGVGAYMMVELTQISPTFKWRLSGQTQTAGAPPVVVQRTFATAKSAATINTDASSTAYKNALSLVHTPGSSEKWLYLAHCGFRSSSSQNNTSAEIRLVRAADGVGPLVGCPRYAANQMSSLLMHAASYGASPGSQSINLDFHVGNGLYSASVFAPEIIGIRLETGEFLTQGNGAANNLTNTTYVDLLTMTETFAADDYYFFAWAAYGSSNTGGVTLALEVDGVLKHEKAMGRHTALNGYFGVIYPATFTAGSKTIKLKGKSNGAWNSTVGPMGICALKKSLFADTASANNGGAVTSTATAYQDFLTTSKALLSGWDYLVLGDLDTKLDGEGVTPVCKAQLARNGSRLGQEFREVPRTAGEYTPLSAGFATVITKALEEDSFALQYATAVNTNTIEVKEGTLLVLALKPSA